MATLVHGVESVRGGSWCVANSTRQDLSCDLLFNNQCGRIDEWGCKEMSFMITDLREYSLASTLTHIYIRPHKSYDPSEIINMMAKK